MTRKRKQVATPNEIALPSPELAARQILRASALEPKLAIVLGSGFAALQSVVKPAVEILFSQLPGFLLTPVDGHEGKLVIGSIEGVPVILLCGRAHYYEGH